jgi:hypothetical protein
MTWKDISVFQYQQLAELLSREPDELDIAIEMCAILHKTTKKDVEWGWDKQRFKKACAELTFVHEQPMPEEYYKHVTVNGRRYRMVYDIRNIRAARVAESKTFAEKGVIPNLHYIAASMVVPQKKTFFGWRDDEYKAAAHDSYASDMLEAPITAINGSVVFFCRVYVESMKSLKGFLTEELVKSMSREKAEETMGALCETLDGFTKPTK